MRERQLAQSGRDRETRRTTSMSAASEEKKRRDQLKFKPPRSRKNVQRDAISPTNPAPTALLDPSPSAFVVCQRGVDPPTDMRDSHSITMLPLPASSIALTSSTAARKSRSKSSTTGTVRRVQAMCSAGGFWRALTARVGTIQLAGREEGERKGAHGATPSSTSCLQPRKSAPFPAHSPVPPSYSQTQPH